MTPEPGLLLAITILSASSAREVSCLWLLYSQRITVPERATDKEKAQGKEACSAGISKACLSRLIFLSCGSANPF